MASLRYNSVPISKRKLTIFAAVHLEARAIAEALGAAYTPRRMPVVIAQSHAEVHLYTVGMRAVHLPRHLRARQTGGIIMAGLAGALDPSLQLGDVILDDTSEGLTARLPFRRGKIHTAAELVATPAEKRALGEQTGAIAVEMENAVVRSWAGELGVSYVGIRAISDTSAETLKPVVMHFIDELGSPKPAAVAAGLWRQPGLIGYLHRLEKASTLAASRLGAATCQIVQAMA